MLQFRIVHCIQDVGKQVLDEEERGIDDHPMYHFSLGDFIRRGRFYICLILGVVFITFVCLVVSLMPISIQ